jgi:hypothetical protein
VEARFGVRLEMEVKVLGEDRAEEVAA